MGKFQISLECIVKIVKAAMWQMNRIRKLRAVKSTFVILLLLCFIADFTGYFIPVTIAEAATDSTEIPKEGYFISEPSDWICAYDNQLAGVTGNGRVLTSGQNDYGECDTKSWKSVVAVSVGMYHTIGLKKNYKVVATGRNDSNQCNVSKWTDIIAIAAADNVSYGLKKDGTVVCTELPEDNILYYGQDQVQNWSDIIDISAGRLHVVGLKKDGTVVAAGSNYNGECNVDGWTNIKKICVSENYTFGITYENKVKVAGTYESSIDVEAVEAWTDIVQVISIGAAVYGLKNNGTIIMTKVGKDFEETSKIKQANIAKWTNIKALAVGFYTLIGLKIDGTVIHEGLFSMNLKSVISWRNVGIKNYTRISEGEAVLKETVIEDPDAIAPQEDFIYDVIDGKVIIEKYLGSSEYLNIPAQFDGYDVTGIAAQAFKSCKSIKVMILPDSITSIGEESFYSCINLRHINIPEGVTKIEAYTFYDCDGLIEIKLPDSVTSIGEAAFSYCRRITDLQFPEDITTLPDSVCSGCTMLSSVTVPDSVTSIGKSAFTWCKGLTSFHFPNGMSNISDNTFTCSNLTYVTIPSNITSIGIEAFSWCTKLKEIYIPASVKSIGEGAFDFSNHEGFVIRGKKNSYAAAYAKKNKIPFKVK